MTIKAGRRIAFATQPVEHPGTHARVAHENRAVVEQVERRPVDKRLVIAGPDDGQIIRVPAHVSEQIRDFESGLHRTAGTESANSSAWLARPE